MSTFGCLSFQTRSPSIPQSKTRYPRDRKKERGGSAALPRILPSNPSEILLSFFPLCMHSTDRKDTLRVFFFLSRTVLASALSRCSPCFSRKSVSRPALPFFSYFFMDILLRLHRRQTWAPRLLVDVVFSFCVFLVACSLLSSRRA